MTDDVVLRLIDVEFRRRRRVIVTGVNLTIKRGEKWVLLGPNGIGKSSLVRMMAARGFPSHGEVHVLGHRLGTVDVFTLRTRIGLSSLELAQAFPAGENPLDAVLGALTATTGRWRDSYGDADYQRAHDLMKRFGIGYLDGKEMYRLSQGELTRTLICRALMVDPELLILDEPTVGLDLAGRETTLRALARIGREDHERTVVLVTHHLEEIPPGFDHIAIMGHVGESRVGDENDEPFMHAGSAQGGDPNPGTIVYAGSIEAGLTGERLGAVFGLPLEVTHHSGRWSARARYEEEGTL